MYARDLMVWLHERLRVLGDFEQTQKRFEALRGYGLLPRGRENAGVRLTDEQIASAVLGFAHPLPAWAGHTALVLGGLRPVGANRASFRKQPTLLNAVADLVGRGKASSDLQRLTLSIEKDFQDDDYKARIYFRSDDQTKIASYVSKYACSLVASGAEKDYDHERLDKLSSVERSFGAALFDDLSRAVAISRHLDRPLKTDWTEYGDEEQKAEFNRKLGARPSSRFMNLRVDAQVTWPKEPTRISFGGHHMVLFPKTKDNSHSISIDLLNERISADDARSLMNRMLSVMSWCDDQPASLHEGWSGNPVPVPIQKQNLAFTTAHEWYFQRTLPNDERLRRCLAFYRDGLNALSAGLSSHAVLSFYRVIETKLQRKWAVVQWVDEIFASAVLSDVFLEQYELDRVAAGLSHGRYIYVRCRVATAHAAIDSPSDPDGTEENRRLLNAARVIQQIARYFIKQEFKFLESYLAEDIKKS